MKNEPNFSVQKFFHKKDNKHWRGVFDEYTICTDLFIKVVADQYKDSGHTDAPYWNIERSNVGMLATACWKNGWVALEEFSTEKKKTGKTSGVGRCDLWVSSKKGNTNYAIEAKKGSCSLASKQLFKNLINILTSACSDAMKLSKDEGDKRMGMAFMHLYLKKSKKSEVARLVLEATEEVEKYWNKRDRPDFVYIYLKNNGVESDNETIIPGVIIAGKKV